MKIIFDYDDCLIRIIDGSYEKVFHTRDVKTAKGTQSIKYQPIWPLIVFNFILKECYPYVEDNYLDVATDIEECIDPAIELPKDYYQIIGKAVRYLNEVVLKDFDRLRINDKKNTVRIDGPKIDGKKDEVGKANYNSRSTYRTYNLSPESACLVIEWEIHSTNLEFIKKYGINEDWMEPKLIVEETVPESPGKTINDALHDEINTVRHIGLRKSAGVVWNGGIISKLVDLFSGELSKIDVRLLPSVNVDCKAEPFTNLKSFILEEYLDLNKYANINSFAMLEGEMGCGKSYSLYSVARAMHEAGHVVIILPLYSLYGESGQNSLISYMCQHMLGGAGLSPIQKVRSLLSKATEEQKVMIIIDSIDEAFPGVYSDLARDMVRILDIGNPNVYLLLAGRQGSLFLENSGLEDVGCINIRCNEITGNALTYQDEDLAVIMNNYPLTRTPLFISYYRELKGLQKDKMRKINLSEYGDEIDFREINNYYDLFRARTSLLKSHSLKDTGSDDVFSNILPLLAYLLYQEKRRTFRQSDIDSINAVSFDGTTPEERADVLLNTGIVQHNGLDRSFVFSHIEYMHFLAAQYAARTLDDSDSGILDEAIRRTSYFSGGQYSRVDKMRFMPFGYYLFMDLVNRQDEKNNKCFDYKLYQLGANIVFEGRDLWDELRPFTADYLNYYRNRIIKDKPAREEYEMTEMVDAVNNVAYTTININRDKKYDRKKMLRDIHEDLVSCVGIVTHDIIANSESSTIEEIGQVKKWDDNFCMQAMRHLITNIERIDISKWKYKPDIIGRLYSNIGACILAKARLNKDKVLLAQAMDYHKIAKEFREVIVSKHSEFRNNISLIRSNVTIGTDYYYYGLWEENAEQAISYFTKAIDSYHNEALRLQGVNPLEDYSYNMSVPVERFQDYEEVPQIGAEAYVIWLLIAGCNYMCYERLKNEKVQDDLQHYLKAQYRALSAAYIFLKEDCIDEEDTNKFDKTKLELNSHEIDKLWGDVVERYLHSFSDFENDNITKCHELLRKIMQLYTSLHEHSRIKDIIYENGIFTIREN